MQRAVVGKTKRCTLDLRQSAMLLIFIDSVTLDLSLYLLMSLFALKRHWLGASKPHSLTMLREKVLSLVTIKARADAQTTYAKLGTELMNKSKCSNNSHSKLGTNLERPCLMSVRDKSHVVTVHWSFWKENEIRRWNCLTRLWPWYKARSLKLKIV